MTTKQPAAVASGLHTDYYHHEDKPVERGLGLCVHSKPVGSVCLHVV